MKNYLSEFDLVQRTGGNYWGRVYGAGRGAKRLPSLRRRRKGLFISKSQQICTTNPSCQLKHKPNVCPPSEGAVKVLFSP